MLQLKLINLQRLFVLIEPIYGRVQIAGWKSGQAAVHLALMQGDFLAALIDGSKTIESRLTKARIAPVGNIARGDLIVFKQVGKACVAVGIVARAKSGPLDIAALNFIKKHADEIGVDDAYLSLKSSSRYYALAWMSDVHQIASLKITKRDRRSWVILSERKPV